MSDLKIIEHVFENGLKALFIKNRKLPLVAYYTFFKVGSRNERSGITGLSHLFEHMMFKGSKKFPEGSFDDILTANGGFSNAYTNKDMTVYYEVFPSQLFENVLEMEADRMQYLEVRKKSLEAERQVVMEERLMRTDNSIEGALIEQLYANSYVAHPYQWPIIGWMSDIEHITLEQCHEYFKIYYAPNNAVIVVSGDIDPQKAIPLMEKYYGSIPSQTTPPSVITKEPLQTGNKYIHVKKKASLQQVLMGYHTLDSSNHDIFALDAMQVIFSNGNSSRLYQRLVEKEKIAIQVNGSFGYQLDPGLFTFHMNLAEDGKPRHLEKCFDEELEKMKNEAVNEKELEKAKNILKSDFVHHLSTIEGRGQEVGRNELLFGDYNLVNNMYQKYSEVTIDKIQEVSRKYFDGGRTMVILDKA